MLTFVIALPALGCNNPIIAKHKPMRWCQFSEERVYVCNAVIVKSVGERLLEGPMRNTIRLNILAMVTLLLVVFALPQA